MRQPAPTWPQRESSGTIHLQLCPSHHHTMRQVARYICNYIHHIMIYVHTSATCPNPKAFPDRPQLHILHQPRCHPQPLPPRRAPPPPRHARAAHVLAQAWKKAEGGQRARLGPLLTSPPRVSLHIFANMNVLTYDIISHHAAGGACRQAHCARDAGRRERTCKDVVGDFAVPVFGLAVEQQQHEIEARQERCWQRCVD